MSWREASCRLDIAASSRNGNGRVDPNVCAESHSTSMKRSVMKLRTDGVRLDVKEESTPSFVDWRSTFRGGL